MVTKSVTTESLVELMVAFSHCVKEGMAVHSTFGELTVAQIRTLVFLKHNPHSPMTSLAKEFHIELPSVTSQVNRLIKQDLVTRESDAHDRRMVRISLTTKGESLLKDAMNERIRHYASILSHLSDDEKKAVSGILQKLITVMNQSYEK